MNPLGIEQLSVFAMPPAEFLELAADLGCVSISTFLAPVTTYNPEGFPDWSLRESKAGRREIAVRARDHGVRIATVEGFAVGGGKDVGALAGDLDAVCDLDCPRISCFGVDKDLPGAIEACAVLAEMAQERGLAVCAEMGSMGPFGLAGAATELVRGVGQANFSLLVDAMHFFRLGNTAEQLAAMDPAAIGYVQLCDAPLAPRFETYMEEALFERMAPGEGELPLRALLAAIGPDIPVSLEVPLRSLAEQGIKPRERLAPVVAAARAMLAAR